MCWSLESSRNSYIIGTIASITLLYYGDSVDKNMGLFFLAVAQIQLIEYFIWSDQSCGTINNYASKMIIPVLTLQIIAIIYGEYYFSSTILTGNTISLLFSIIFALSIVFNIYNCYFTYNQKLCSKQISNKGIIWDKGNIINGKSIISSLSSLLYFGSFLILPLFWKSNLKKYTFVFYGCSSYLLIRYFNQITWKSRWCFPTAFVPIFFVFIMFLQRYKWIPSNI